MAIHRFLVASILISCFAATCYGGVRFSSLPMSLNVTASPTAGQGQELKGGVDKITVTWSLNSTFGAGADSTYKTVKAKLCYAPISQNDRVWRRSADELKKDKTCQHKIVARPYSTSNNTVTYTVLRDVPTATYFVRVYAVNAAGEEVAYGQSTNLFKNKAVSGRHPSLIIASSCFSALSILSLVVFFFLEKIKVN